jgi:hypothetical protein
VLVGDQPVGVLSLGVQRIRGDDGGGQVQALQHRPEPRDLVGGVVYVCLAQHGVAGVVHRREQVHRRGVVAPLPRRVLPSTRPPAVTGQLTMVAGRWGGMAAGGPAIGRWPGPRASGSTRPSTRRTAASVGGRKAPVGGSRRVPSAASTWPAASWAHSPITPNDLAPASTAQAATASTAPSACRRPRRCLGSGIWARSASRLRHWSPASAAVWPRGRRRGWGMMSRQAGTAVRSGHGLRHPHDRRWSCLLHINPAHSPDHRQPDKPALLPEP